MKKISIIILFISLIQFLSGCSQGYSSNTNPEYSIQQQQAAAQKQQAQIRANAQRQRLKQASYKHRTKSSNRARPATKSNHALQQTRSNVAVSQQHERNLISKIAHSTIGKPYKWGGNNPHQGFDCSGLMSYVHKNALGINIPRTAAEQRDQSRTINYAQLQPGDMLFFKTGGNSNHVGIYIGNRKFVHAATGSKAVKVATMDSPYWHKRFVKFGTFL